MVDTKLPALFGDWIISSVLRCLNTSGCHDIIALR